MAERIDAYNAGTPYAASRLWLVEEQGRQVCYGIWVLGNDYRARTTLYGAYPPDYLPRMMRLFGDVPVAEITPRGLEAQVLHACSGSLPPGPYVRLDLNPAREPDVCGSVYDVAGIFATRGHFRLCLVDPPYSDEDAVAYETPMVNRRRAMASLADVIAPGGHLVWLDVTWPIHRKAQWQTVGRIAIVRSTNHRVRIAHIFERTP
jgi:hypothetical protein